MLKIAISIIEYLNSIIESILDNILIIRIVDGIPYCPSFYNFHYGDHYF